MFDLEFCSGSFMVMRENSISFNNIFISFKKLFNIFHFILSLFISKMRYFVI